MVTWAGNDRVTVSSLQFGNHQSDTQGNHIVTVSLPFGYYYGLYMDVTVWLPPERTRAGGINRLSWPSGVWGHVH